MPLVQAKSVVDGSAVNVIDVLKSENEIPAYQRDYVWQKKQIVQLWEDLIEHFKRYNHNEELIDPEPNAIMPSMSVTAGVSHRLIDHCGD